MLTDTFGMENQYKDFNLRFFLKMQISFLIRKMFLNCLIRAKEIVRFLTCIMFLRFLEFSRTLSQYPGIPGSLKNNKLYHVLQYPEDTLMRTHSDEVPVMRTYK